MSEHTLRNGLIITSKKLRFYEDKGMSEEEISQIYGITRMGLYKIRKKIDCSVRFRSDKGKDRIDPEVRRERYNAYQRKYYRENISKTQRNGHRIDKYQTTQKSRWVMVGKLGRLLEPGEVVHHIDGNQKNDDPSNLMLFASQADHLAWHRGEDVKPVEK